MADGGEDAPLFKKIERSVAEQIIRGEYAPGARLPSESELMTRFGASRQTVSKAITELAKLGLVERNRRAGTSVSRRFQQRFVLPLYDISKDVEERGRLYEFEVIERRKIANGAQGQRWSELPDGAGLLYVETLHRADGAPAQFERRLINLIAAPGAVDEPFKDLAPGAWLSEHVPWSRVRHRITAVNADAALAGKLQLPLGGACFMLERRTYHLDLPITLAYLAHPGDRFPMEGEYNLGAVEGLTRSEG